MKKVRHGDFPAEEVYYWTERMPIGRDAYDITAALTSRGLCWLSLGQEEQEERAFKWWAKRWLPGSTLTRKREPIAEILRQMQDYLEGKRREFSVPLHQEGTPFQLKVWQELLKIPYGETLSYAEVAERVGTPRGQRAVGMANHQNPIAVIVPCHRVIGKNGSLTGYGGGLDLKEELLRIEKGGLVWTHRGL
ncbi:methylated-DNA--[protein]-cysteine S-methyltransferase [Paradesulfitobacterium ferrireducens]|uniref:methylated-DNA--[protein]-cysteine S-methyltransferase n=1 Tax=Paradesulfitobacterium ferrireducens TaxID=2816476 RepID=UPI002E2BAE4D|nr:methylated-DNA--[protein]-cysteine S-methyltransferase [Paradesulfitobacterium ferrireducens]